MTLLQWTLTILVIAVAMGVIGALLLTPAGQAFFAFCGLVAFLGAFRRLATIKRCFRALQRGWPAASLKSIRFYRPGFSAAPTSFEFPDAVWRLLPSHDEFRATTSAPDDATPSELLLRALTVAYISESESRDWRGVPSALLWFGVEAHRSLEYLAFEVLDLPLRHEPWRHFMLQGRWDHEAWRMVAEWQAARAEANPGPLAAPPAPMDDEAFETAPGQPASDAVLVDSQVAP